MQLMITPKRRRKFLAPDNVKAWSDALVRPGCIAADIIPLDEIVGRYLEDVKAEPLLDQPEAMESLRRAMSAALWQTWGICTDDENDCRGADLLELERRKGKVQLTIPSATILNRESGFNEKGGLATRGSVTAGSACMFSCTYCSVGATMCRSPHTRILRLLGLEHGDAVIRRLNPVETLHAQLIHKDGSLPYKNDRGVVFISPVVDPLPNTELTCETRELIDVILDLTGWDIRVLSKSTLIQMLAKQICSADRARVVFGLSIGILDDKVGKAVERLTSLPSKRLEAYRELQASGLRTFSMHCPVLPQANYVEYAERLAASVNWGGDEQVWAEALNSRGKSNQRTIEALKTAGFAADAASLEEVSRSRAAWEFGYNRPLFEALAAVCPPEKFRYLVYPDDADRDHWLARRDRGAVVLGEESQLAP